MKTTQPTQAPQQPKTVAFTTYVQTLIITAMTFGLAGMIGGYFLSIQVNSQAREAVVRDMQVVKTQK